MTDVRTGSADSVYRVLAAAGGSVYFQVSDVNAFGLRGSVWELQADPPGPVVEPLFPMATAVAPPVTTLTINNRVFYAGTGVDSVTGAELGVLDLCPADYDNSGSVSVQDIFAFLDGFFRLRGQTGSGLGPDITRNGVVDVGDLFEFLNMYFAGCP
jgi:hypothetical protein